eukprot:6174856-Pleurochrysis_carterae.AAC.2
MKRHDEGDAGFDVLLGVLTQTHAPKRALSPNTQASKRMKHAFSLAVAATVVQVHSGILVKYARANARAHTHTQAHAHAYAHANANAHAHAHSQSERERERETLTHPQIFIISVFIPSAAVHAIHEDQKACQGEL